MAGASTQLRTVTVGPSRLVKAGGGRALRPQLAVADRLVVQLQTGTKAPATLSLGSKRVGRVERALGHGLYTVSLPAGSDVVAAATAARTLPGVVTAGPDLIVYPAVVPNDPHYGDQYHLPQVMAPAGWDVTTGSSAVTVAIIDSGVYTDHPDLAANIWTNADEIAGNKIDDDGNGYKDDVRGWDFYDNNNNPNPTPNGEDDDGLNGADEQVNHGTLVAGTAVAAGNDGYGVCGVAWGCKIMALQVFPDDGGTAVSTVVEAIEYAVANGARVINLSIGGSYTDLFTAPIAAAYAAGVVVVSAGGNDSEELTDAESTWESPVCNDGSGNHVLGVGAVDRNDRLSSYSNFDSSSHHFIDIVAPGDAIYGTAAYFPAYAAFTSYFQSNSGTSFSAPIATGLAALLLSHSPALTPAEVMEKISGSGDDIDSLNPGYAGKLGGGRLNCARALGVPLPPEPARDLAAVDTPDDDGGSITVTWRTSPDDGAGADSVVRYLLLRRTGESGSFTKIATLPAGTESYTDTAVTDGTSYYYLVRTSDGTLTSDTDAVGPAQPANDAPPAGVTGLLVYDRPNDTGKAVILRWDSYTAPADFAGFAIYRAAADFSTTTGLTALKVLTDSSATNYVDTGVTDGVDYYYAVGVRDTLGNETRSLRALGPVQSFSNEAVTFAAGLHFLGPATVPSDSDPATLFALNAGSFAYARWSPSEEGYEYDPGSRPLAESLQLGLGRGFWVRFPQAVTMHPTGSSAPAGDFEVALTPGWHQLANPFFGPITFAEATVTYQGATMDLLSADSAGITAAFCWMYDNSSGTYTLAYPSLTSTETLIPAWRGFWVLCYKPCTLTIARPYDASTSAVRALTKGSGARTAAAVKWLVPLRVSSAAGRDSTCYVGLASRPLTVSKPPPAAAAPVLTMGRPGADTPGGYAVSLAQTATSVIIWEMQVTNLQAGQEVRLQAPDLSALPNDSVALLEDCSSGQTVYLRTSNAYSFTPREGEQTRRLRLSISPRSSAVLAVQGLGARQSRSGGAQVVFSLSAPATCSASVLNVAGRKVRTLEEGKVRSAGNNVLLWDGRNQLGSKVPPGLYLLQVTAGTSSGQSAQAVQPLRLQ